MHRLFVALRPPEDVRDLLLDAMEGADLKWQDEGQLHLTLRFIGEVERRVANDLATILSGIAFAPFALSIDGVGRFDHGRRGALWAGVSPKAQVKALAAKIERACQAAGLPPERRAFHPHVTLARWNGGRPNLEPWLQAHAGIRSAAWPVRTFQLFESHLLRTGAHYEQVLEVALRGAG